MKWRTALYGGQCSTGAHNTVLEAQALGNGRRQRRGSKRAKVALARKIAVILRRMWVEDTTYRWTDTQPVAVQV
jgi:hypothetical protein